MGIMGMYAYAAATSYNVDLTNSYSTIKSGTKSSASPQGTIVSLTKRGSGSGGYTTIVVQLYRNGSSVSGLQQVVLGTGNNTVSPTKQLYAGDYLSLLGKMAAFVFPGFSVNCQGQVNFQ